MAHKLSDKLSHLYMEKNRKWKNPNDPKPNLNKTKWKKKTTTKKQRWATLKLKLNYVFFCNLQKYKEKDKHKQKYKKQSESSPSLVPSLTVTTEKVSWCIFFFLLFFHFNYLCWFIIFPAYATRALKWQYGSCILAVCSVGSVFFHSC